MYLIEVDGGRVRGSAWCSGDSCLVKITIERVRCEVIVHNNTSEQHVPDGTRKCWPGKLCSLQKAYWRQKQLCRVVDWGRKDRTRTDIDQRNASGFDSKTTLSDNIYLCDRTSEGVQYGQQNGENLRGHRTVKRKGTKALYLKRGKLVILLLFVAVHQSIKFVIHIV